MARISNFIKDTFFTLHRPAWQERLPRGLRLAAEWQFGMWILLPIVATFMGGDLLGAVLGIALSGFFFLMLTGWREDQTISNPVGWWSLVLALSALGASGVIFLLVTQPDL